MDFQMHPTLQSENFCEQKVPHKTTQQSNLGWFFVGQDDDAAKVEWL